jgi:anti-sigma-K factor RskA
MTSSEDCSSLKNTVPLYVKGLLQPAEKAEFERRLEDCPSLRDEVLRWTALRDAYKAVEEDLPGPSAEAYSRIQDRIQAGRHFSLGGWLRRPLPYAPVMIAAQLLIIIGLLFSLSRLTSEFKTLSASSVSSENTVRINIVFREDATEAEIRTLLLSVDANIVDGPHRSGLYVVAIPADGKTQEILDMLGKERIVTLAERHY